MKVCILGDAGSVHLQRITPGLAERGVDVTLICHKPCEIPGVRVERFAVPPLSLRHPYRWQRRYSAYLRDLMRRYDVVNVHFLLDWGFTPEIIERGCFVATPWGSDITPPPGEEEASRELANKRVMMLRNATLVTTLGPSFAELIARFAAIDASSFVELPLGVDIELFTPVDRPARRDGQYKVGYFKGFRPVYGATYLMRAIPTVVEALPGTRFHLIGDGAQLERCRELAGYFGVASDVKWIRRQPHENIPNHLAGWDLSVISSICESFGAAALESSAMKVPVVATRVGGLPDTVLDGETGLLVPPESPEQMADAIITLLRDAPRRRQMGEAGRTYVEQKYEWGGILDKWVETYAAARDRVMVMV